jgi:hypothetical protein
MKNEELYFYIRMLQQISIFISVYSSSIQYDRITTLGNVDVFTNRYSFKKYMPPKRRGHIFFDETSACGYINLFLSVLKRAWHKTLKNYMKTE